MTKDEIIALGREATAPEWWDNEDGWHMGMDLQRFADSVAAAAVAAEREACARVCDGLVPPNEWYDFQRAAGQTARECGKAIRARALAKSTERPLAPRSEA